MAAPRAGPGVVDTEGTATGLHRESCIVCGTGKGAALALMPHLAAAVYCTCCAAIRCRGPLVVQIRRAIGCAGLAGMVGTDILWQIVWKTAKGQRMQRCGGRDVQGLQVSM